MNYAVVLKFLSGRLPRGFAIHSARPIVSRILNAVAALFLVAVSTQTSVAQSMSLPGKFSVSNAGGAIYQIPIALPPGTGGMSPSLSLDYNSQSGNSILGVGWSLAGLPVIDRCPRTFAQDGVRGAVNYDSNDRYCMDGQRLIAVSGAYGADGTEYRTELESFNRIISHGTAGNGPSWFEVRTKSGQTMEFGHTADSQILAVGKTTARNWLVGKVSDTKGNYFTVSYTNDTVNGQAYPIEINYTGNATAGLAPYNKVQFVYASRSDIVSAYHAGSLSQTTVRLTNVKTYAGGSLVADYGLAYQQGVATSRSRLTSVTLCASGGACMPPTSFSWQEGNATFDVPVGGLVINGSVGGSTSDPAYGRVNIADVNGDGRADTVLVVPAPTGLYVYTLLSDNTGGYTLITGNPTTGGALMLGADWSGFTPTVADVNGDGKADIVLVQADGNGLLVATLLSNGDGTYFTMGGLTVGGNWSGGYFPIAGDVNADGKSDVVLMALTTSGLYAYTMLSNGNGTFSLVAGGSSTALLAGSSWTTYSPTVIDVNGDGKTDVVLVSASSVGLYIITLLSNGDGTYTITGGNPANSSALVSGDNWAGGYFPLTADVNGDGSPDIVLMASTASGLYVYSLLSTGNGTFALVAGGSGTALLDGSNWTIYRPGVGDVNGDGKTDVTMTSATSSGLYVYTLVSNGNGTFALTGGNLSTGAGFINNWNWGTNAYSVSSVDFDGDGKSDVPLVQVNSSGVWAYSLRATGKVPDLLLSISNGLTTIASITYQPLTASSIYTKDTTSVYPQLDFQGAMYVVSRVDANNGQGGNYSTAYSYAGAKVDLNGRGLLGFRQMKVTDLQIGIVETTNYLQSFPYIGSVVSTTKTLSTLTLAQTAATYQFSNVTNGATVSAPSTSSAPYRVSVAQSVTGGSDLDGTTLPSTTSTFQYDAYGNATQVAVANSDGSSKTTANTYTNNATNWLLGRLTASTVAGQAP